jgi:hypothetical protein
MQNTFCLYISLMFSWHTETLSRKKIAIISFSMWKEEKFCFQRIKIRISVRHDGINMPIIPALRSLRQKDCEFEASLGYIVRLNRKGGLVLVEAINEWKMTTQREFALLVEKLTILSNCYFIVVIIWE